MISLWRDTSWWRRLVVLQTTNQASEINRLSDWSKVRRDFTLTPTSGWQQTVVVVSEGKGLKGGVERAKHTWERDELKPEQGVIILCNQSVLVLPLCLLPKPQSSVTPKDRLPIPSYNLKVSVLIQQQQPFVFSGRHKYLLKSPNWLKCKLPQTHAHISWQMLSLQNRLPCKQSIVTVRLWWSDRLTKWLSLSVPSTSVLWCNLRALKSAWLLGFSLFGAMLFSDHTRKKLVIKVFLC